MKEKVFLLGSSKKTVNEFIKKEGIKGEFLNSIWQLRGRSPKNTIIYFIGMYYMSDVFAELLEEIQLKRFQVNRDYAF